jgi:hypothetical protein
VIKFNGTLDQAASTSGNRPRSEGGSMTPNQTVSFGPEILERMVRAVEAVRERLNRATAALDKAGIPYAVVGGNAVAAWVASVDPSAVRNTQDVDILLRRADVDAAAVALAAVGFVRQEVLGITIFLDGPEAVVGNAVHVVYAAEKVREDYADPAPDVSQTDAKVSGTFRVVVLEPLVRIKLTSYRRKDQVHLQDLIGVGLIDASWLGRLPAELAARLQELLDNPDG